MIMAEFSICSAVWEVLFPIISLCLYKSSQCFSAIFMTFIKVLAQNGLKTARIRARLTCITLKWPILRESFHKVRRPDECWSVSVVTSAQQSYHTLSTAVTVYQSWHYDYTQNTAGNLQHGQIIYSTPLICGTNLMFSRNHFYTS